MPTVTYIGRSHIRRNCDSKFPDWEQNKPVEVTAAWLDFYHPRLDEINFRIEGWEVSEDIGNDGIPDEAWSRKDISAWLANYNIKPKGYATKSTLLELVATVMSPDGVAETEELVAESAEEEE
tara:strand:- start:792 stop:1160 length:369 start_codon:yes stop_codon:yes gene_type:complete